MIYDFHYNYIKTKCGDKAKLFCANTDSIAYEIITKDIYKDINPDIEKRFHTIDYPTNHPYGIKTDLNSKALGMFKDEAGGRQIVEFVGLRANLYSYQMLDGSEDKKYEGWQWMLQKGVFISLTTESAYLAGRINIEILLSFEVIVNEMYTEEINKIILSSDDEKRVIMADGIHTLAYGHTKLKNCN